MVNQTRSVRRARPACAAAELFDVLWATLADVLGPTATAALLQRSVKRASVRQPELHDLVIRRERFVYTYTVPTSWKRPDAQARPALKQVVSELWPLLAELTGPVVVRRLREVPELRRCGVIPAGDAEP
jgi:hypothetical protein